MKKLLFMAAIAVVVASCNNPTTNKVCKKTTCFNFEGMYQTPSSDTQSVGYYQTLEISKEDTLYNVNFSGSLIKEEPGCSFNGNGVIKNDTLYVNVGDSTQTVWMCITPSKDSLGLSVFAKNPEQRAKLMYYCCGGSSLAGTYYNGIITKNKVGNISRSAKINTILKAYKNASFAQQDKENNLYNLADEDNNPLMTFVTDKDSTINQIIITNAVYNTEKGIHLFSTVKDVITAYPDAVFEVKDNQAIIKENSLKACFIINREDLGKNISKLTIKTLPKKAKINKIVLQ